MMTIDYTEKRPTTETYRDFKLYFETQSYGKYFEAQAELNEEKYNIEDWDTYVYEYLDELQEAHSYLFNPDLNNDEQEVGCFYVDLDVEDGNYLDCYVKATKMLKDQIDKFWDRVEKGLIYLPEKYFSMIDEEGNWITNEEVKTDDSIIEEVIERDTNLNDELRAITALSWITSVDSSSNVHPMSHLTEDVDVEVPKTPQIETPPIDVKTSVDDWFSNTDLNRYLK